MVVQTGLFTDEIPERTGFAINGKVNIVGKGDRPVSFTAREDIAGGSRFVIVV